MSTIRQKAKRIVPQKLHKPIGDARRRLIANPFRLELQKRRFLRDPSLTPQQLKSVQTVNTKIHHRDGMFAGNVHDYFRAGLSAVECVDDVLAKVLVEEKDLPIKDMLDLPCGYGRELRFLLQRFPQAIFTACDIQPGAVDFCSRAFGALPAYSKPNIAELIFERQFDLIWCGSLITHLDADSIRSLVKVFSDHIKPRGVMIVTTNGNFVAEQIKAGATYELPVGALRQLVEAYDELGYAYCDYSKGQGYFEFHPEKRGYGVSITSPSWFRSLVGEFGMREIYFSPRGWANHQDVFGFSM